MSKRLAFLTHFFGFNAALIIGFFIVRLTVDTVVRMFFPFITPFAYGFGLTITSFGVLLSLRSWIGIINPFIGIVADRYGKKRVMMFGLLMQGIGLLSMIVVQGWAAAVPMLLIGIGAASFVPIGQAYISDQVDYETRGRVLIFIEMSFAISGIIGLPVVGWLIDTAGWRYPLGIIGVLSLFAILFIWRIMPADVPGLADTASRSPISDLRVTLSKPVVQVVMTTALLMFFAFTGFSIIWAIWAGEQFGLSTIEIGLLATKISLAELAFVVFSMLFIDRIGKRLMVRFGFLFAIILLLAWWWLPAIRWSSQINLLLLGGVFELTIVSFFPLISDLLPKSRATLFSLTIFGGSIGMALAPPISLFLWAQYGLTGFMILMVLALTVALWLINGRLIRESVEK
ncbi:MAG: MFS family permease [Candidatus Promineifilaceae bacterium]|jgi:MFS family permease